MSDPLTVYEFDRFRLDAKNRRLSYEGNSLHVPPKLLDALALLLQRFGSLVSKDEIHRVLWPDTFVEDVTLARVISDLRRLLAQHSNTPYIETVSKHGYRFTAHVAQIGHEFSGRAPGRSNNEDADVADLVRRAWHAARKWSPDAVGKGLEYARHAIDLNPSLAEAHAVLAYLFLYAGFGFLPGVDAFPRARAAAATALQLDSQCAPAHAVLGMLKLAIDRDLATAEEALLKSIELAPDMLPGRFAYSHLLLISGRFDEALSQAEMALEIDPLHYPVAYHIGSIFYYAGRYEEAIAQLLKFEYLDPDFLAAHQMLAILYAHLNRAPEALEEASKATRLSGSSTRGKATLAMVNALLGKRNEARGILQELLDKPEIPGFRWSYALAAIYSYLKERDAAFECLKRACEERDGALIYFKFDPHFLELHVDPRFLTIVEAIGI